MEWNYERSTALSVDDSFGSRSQSKPVSAMSIRCPRPGRVQVKNARMKPFVPLFSTFHLKTNPFLEGGAATRPALPGNRRIKTIGRGKVFKNFQRTATRFTSRLHHTPAGFENLLKGGLMYGEHWILGS